jgi:hypothetical protein
LREKVAVFVEAVQSITNLRRRNIALMVGHGARNIAAVFLTTLARTHTLTPSATMTGSGLLSTSVARRSITISNGS